MSSSADNFFEAVEIHKRLGEQDVLRGATLRIRRGETFVLLGRSGEGKSVMLKHLVGLFRPDSGRITVDGEVITGLSERELAGIRQKIGVLFQNGALFDSFDVGRNVAFPLREAGLRDWGEIERRVREALELVGMGAHLEKMPVHLSGGQRKRVALARAVIGRPECVLYDEPTAGLDPIATANIDRLIRAIQERYEVTSLVITHDLKSVERVADRVGFLRGGRVHFVGTADEFLHSDDPVLRDFVEGRPDEEVPEFS